MPRLTVFLECANTSKQSDNLQTKFNVQAVKLFKYHRSWKANLGQSDETGSID